jgi:hypothetical protein
MITISPGINKASTFIMFVQLPLTEEDFAMWWHSVLRQLKFINKVQ